MNKGIIRIGFAGLGSRGIAAVKRYGHIPGAEIAAICDKDPDAVENARGLVGKDVRCFSGEKGWMDMCLVSDISLIYICTDWLTHAGMACFAMRHGKDVAVEVPAATSISECNELVRTVSDTGRRFMMLENCIYDRFEVSTCEMARAGLFGEIYHAEGGYIHHLDYEKDWRRDFSENHRGDVYPTHGIAPICRLMNIGGDDMMETISSFETTSYGAAHTTSVIRTVKGRTIILQHNVHAPRPYSRLYRFTGTKGGGCKYPDRHLSFISEPDEWLDKESMDALIEKYSPEWVDEVSRIMPADEESRRFMDYAMDVRLISALREGREPDMNVLDAVNWSCISELSRISIERGSVPVPFPDFRNL